MCFGVVCGNVLRERERESEEERVSERARGYKYFAFGWFVKSMVCGSVIDERA